MDRKPDQNRKERADLNNIVKVNTTDICRTLYLTTMAYTFSQSAHGAFSRISHMAGHTLCLNGFEKVDIIQSIFSDHNGLKLEISKKEK